MLTILLFTFHYYKCIFLAPQKPILDVILSTLKNRNANFFSNLFLLLCLEYKMYLDFFFFFFHSDNPLTQLEKIRLN